MPFLPYGESYKKQRRLFLRSFDQHATALSRIAQERHVKILLHDLSENPHDFRNIVKRYVVYYCNHFTAVHVNALISRAVSAMIVKAVYDLDDKIVQDVVMEDLKKAAVLLSQVGNAGGTMFDVIPIREL